MKKYLVIKLCAIVFAINANAQSTIDTVLANIANNNKAIVANTQYWEAQKLQFKTGLMPNNPAVKYDFIVGSPSNAGNQTDITLTQEFDFPTAYGLKKQLSERQIEVIEFQLAAQRQEVLLKAKVICIELVYRNKLQSRLIRRKRNTEKLLNDFQKKLEVGEGNILDVNKAQLQRIEISREFQRNSSTINQLNQKLTELNGGNAVLFADTIYPLVANIPAFDQLISDIENVDPILKILEGERLVTQTKVELIKAMSLPKFEMGYHYQGLLGQRFNGASAGITIPLWENKNKVKSERSKLQFYDLNLQKHHNEHYSEIKQFYEKYQNLQITLTEYQTVLASLNNTTLLNKALELGQISTIEYFMEMSYYYNAFNNYLQAENEYYEAIAEMQKSLL